MDNNKIGLFIRQATKHDLTEIEALYEQRVLYNDAHHTHQWCLADVTWCELSKLYTWNHCYVGIHDGHIAGVMMIVDEDQLYWPQANKGEALYLHKLCIHPSNRGNGFADCMIQYFIQKGRMEAYPCVRLDVREHKTKLREMYERNGFKLNDIKSVHLDFKTALYSIDFNIR